MSMPSSIRQPGALLAIAALVVLVIVAGCEVTGSVVGGPPPIAPGPVGPIVPNPNGGPPIECRGMPILQCQQSAGDPGRPDVVRMVITCTKVCTPTNGEYRLDYITADGRVEQAGGGAYASGPAIPAPAPGEPVPAESG